MDAAANTGLQAARESVEINLPQYLTNFVGRRTELSRVRSLVRRSRLVTLTGPGGAGKSRLAAELGRACLDLWPKAVWWVGLASTEDPRQVAGAVVSVLELTGRGSAQDVAVAWLANRRALLVLDNCEHVLTACADFCQAALDRCPELTIIATSREALGIHGEAQWPVSTLPASDAARLFEARAALVRPDFKVAEPNAELVTEICERIDHLPLAIELAAARIGLMTEQEILDQLAHRFQLLAGGNRNVPKRQRTLAATIDWSYRLLTENEALVFRHLSVFRGGFDLDSVQAVCADLIDGSLLDSLGGLVQKSMLVAEPMEGSGTRYRLLESQLAYAQDRLRDADEAESTRRRHYGYYLESLVAKTRNPALARPPPGYAESQWIARELGNLWAAMRWAQTNADDLGLTFAAYLSRVTFGDVAQARRVLEDALEHSHANGLPRIYALRSAANLAYWQGDGEAALRAAESALALAREVGDVEVLAYTLTVTAVAHELLGELESAIEMYDEAGKLLQGSGNRPLLTQIRVNLAWLGFLKGDYATARDTLIDCAATSRVEGDLLLLASCLNGLAWSRLRLDDHKTAADGFKEALGISRSFMDKQELIEDLQGLLCVAGVSGDDQRVLRLAAAARRLSSEWSVKSEPWPEAEAEKSQTSSRSRLGKREADAAWDEGWAMSLDRVVEYALEESDPDTLVEAGPLSRRELEVAKLVAEGMTNRQIGQRLFISPRTVDGHVERMRTKLGVRSRTEVATWAVGRGLTSSLAASKPGTVKKRKTRIRSPSPQRS